MVARGNALPLHQNLQDILTCTCKIWFMSIITWHYQSFARYIYWSLNFIIGDIQRNNCEKFDPLMHVWNDPLFLYVKVSVWITFTYELMQSARYEGHNFECNITTPYHLDNIDKFWIDELKQSTKDTCIIPSL